MNPDYLQEYYFYEREHWWFLIREKIIRQQLNRSLPRNRELKILNIGAATGRSSEMLQQYGKVISVEKDAGACIFLREKLNLDVIQADIESLPFGDNVFDVVCIFDVIEHIERQEQAVAELYRVCKNDGILYCSVPAFAFLWSVHDEVNHHKRRYTRRSINKVLGGKFAVEYSTYFNALLFLPIWLTRTIIQRIRTPRKAVSDFAYGKILNGRFLGLVFKAVFSMELLLLRYLTIPFGVSILIRARKTASFS